MNTDAKRYYAVLGVDPAASEEAIRGAYRRRAKELHPDARSGNATAFILLKRAYDTLLDPEHRAAYDRACRPAAPRPAPADRYQRRQSYRSLRPSPAPPQSKPTSRRGGVGFVRYAVAFLIMAAVSLGGVQAMIILTGAPPSIQTRSTTPRADTGSDTRAAATPDQQAAPGSSKSGFWDPTPAKKTP